jgi:aminopeptidase
LWKSARDISVKGIAFVPNMPTEEVFTMPHKDRVSGIVTSSKPLNYGGTLIENFRLTFAEGRVVDVAAGSGEATLRKLVETDDGASRLGEVALVPHSSPIAQSGLLFYNTLFDENAASHIALGRAYQFTLEGGTAMSVEEFGRAGGNNSLVHVDFMIGSDSMDIDGLTEDGVAEPVMRGGEWAFEV